MNGTNAENKSPVNSAEMAELQTKFRSARKALPQQLNILKGLDLVDPVTNKCLFRAIELGRRIIVKSEELRRKTIDTLWAECIYPTIAKVRRHKPDEDLRAAFCFFTSSMVGFLQDVAALHPELSFSVFCYCGDLSRYRAMYDGAPEYYTKVAEQRYMAALQTHQSDSCIYNRLGVLYQKDDIYRSMLCFAQALTEENPFEGAISNIKNMDEEKVPAIAHNKLLKLTLEYAHGFLSSSQRYL
uniref:TPR_REGION domain-containing protein n=1 Tax=Steinernema glaseri TaxID=37863 RepID=A0A1I7YY76_9BILA